MKENKAHITENEFENLLNLADFLSESVFRLEKEGKICKSEFPVLFAEKCSMPNGQKKKSHTSHATIAECRSLSDMKME